MSPQQTPRTLRFALTTATTLLLGACAMQTSPVRSSAASDAGDGPHAAAPASAPAPRPVAFRQDDPMALLHPPLMVTLGLAVGERTLEINQGDPAIDPPVISGDTTGFLGRLEAEYFFRNQFGLFAGVELGNADDILEDFEANSEFTSVDIGAGVAFRATLDDDFRMPVRLGIYSYQSEQDGDGFGNIDRMTVGVRLSAEPEYIILQNIAEDGTRTELSTFLEVGAGAGPSTIEGDVAPGISDEEDGYAFNLAAEIGVRYTIWNMVAGFSLLAKKVHFDMTESYDGDTRSVFFSTDDDFVGAMLTFGVRM